MRGGRGSEMVSHERAMQWHRREKFGRVKGSRMKKNGDLHWIFGVHHCTSTPPKWRIFLKIFILIVLIFFNRFLF